MAKVNHRRTLRLGSAGCTEQGVELFGTSACDAAVFHLALGDHVRVLMFVNSASHVHSICSLRATTSTIARKGRQPQTEAMSGAAVQAGDLRHIASTHLQSINLRGTLDFPIELCPRHGSSLEFVTTN